MLAYKRSGGTYGGWRLSLTYIKLYVLIFLAGRVIENRDSEGACDMYKNFQIV